jgi:predicted amidophosphoribosyltransferase
LVVPVPLHPARLRRRGYNQSLLLARQLATGLQVPCSAGLVRRIRNTLPQQGQSRDERQHNLLGAFALDERLAQQFPGVQSIAIVDDVVTTSSTAREVASVLQAGMKPAPAIHLWALARA